MGAVPYTPGPQGFTARKQNQRNSQENSRVVEDKLGTEPRGIWGMGSARGKSDPIHSGRAQEESGLLQQGLWADSSQGYKLQGLGTGLRKAERPLNRSVGQGQHGMDLQAPGCLLLTLGSTPSLAQSKQCSMPVGNKVTSLLLKSHLSSDVRDAPASLSSAEPLTSKE